MKSLFNAMGAGGRSNCPAEMELLFAVANRSAKTRRSERFEVPEYDDRFEEAGFSGAVGTGHDVRPSAESHLFELEISKILDRDVNQFHYSPPSTNGVRFVGRQIDSVWASGRRLEAWPGGITVALA